MKFENLNILLISPNYWGTMFVSKHWYAIELAKRGNNVYFLEPPRNKQPFQIELLKEYSSLYIVRYATFQRGIKFLPKFLSKHLEWLDKNS